MNIKTGNGKGHVKLCSINIFDNAERRDYMIDEKKLVGTLRQYYDKVLDQDISDDEKLAKHDMLPDVMFEINNQPKTDRWIPCSVRLPDEGQRVLTTHEGAVNPNRQVIQHIFWKGKFRQNWDMDNYINSSTFGQRYMGDVIAWMPLPEPYQS